MEPWQKSIFIISKIIAMSVFINFDALAQTSNFRIEMRQVVFLCWTRVSGTKSLADWMPADKPTELSTIKQKIELNRLYLWSASIPPTRHVYNQ